MLTIRSYAELDGIVKVFASGRYNLFILVGGPGQGKSRTVREAVESCGEEFLWIKNTVSAFRLYRDIYKHRHGTILVIDDVDSFYSDRGLVRLLKALCETEDVKTLAWHTDAARLDREAVPREFTVSMRVAILANDFRSLNKNVTALEDRGRVFSFEPNAREVHRRAGSWIEDEEIYDFIGERLGLLNGRLTLRDYMKAADDKAGGLDWRRMLLDDKGVTDEEFVFARLAAMPFATEEERVREFVRLTGRSRATYFRRKRVLGVVKP